VTAAASRKTPITEGLVAGELITASTDSASPSGGPRRAGEERGRQHRHYRSWSAIGGLLAPTERSVGMNADQSAHTMSTNCAFPERGRPGRPPCAERRGALERLAWRLRSTFGKMTRGAHHMMQRYLKWLAGREGSFIHLIRIAIFIVMAWIGGLKFVPYEAESIVPLVANSPVMEFFYAKPAPEYKQYMNKEGELVPENRAWHQENRTYLFADFLGTVIIAIGILVLLGLFSPTLGFIGALLAAAMSCVTLSFLITTPEAWVSHFPYLSGGGRLVVKDVIMLSGALVCLSSSAQELLKEHRFEGARIGAATAAAGVPASHPAPLPAARTAATPEH
jgi:uncharacterized membrane protein YkgB